MNVKNFLLAGIGFSLLLATMFTLMSVATGKAYNQEVEFEKLVLERLQEKRVPVKSVSIVGESPYQLEVILQSTSNNTQVAPDDPSYIHAVQREVALLDKGNLNLDTITITILDAATANVLYWGKFSLSEISPLAHPSNMTKETQEQLKNWITNEYISSENVTIETLTLSTDSYGPIMTLNLTTSSVESANVDISSIMSNRWGLINEIKESHDLEISILKLKLFNEKREILLDYTLDLQLEQETWWMDDRVTAEWFPNPLPADSP